MGSGLLSKIGTIVFPIWIGDSIVHVQLRSRSYLVGVSAKKDGLAVNMTLLTLNPLDW